MVKFQHSLAPNSIKYNCVVIRLWKWRMWQGLRNVPVGCNLFLMNSRTFLKILRQENYVIHLKILPLTKHITITSQRLNEIVFNANLALFFNVEGHHIVKEDFMRELQPLYLLPDSSVRFLRRHVSL